MRRSRGRRILLLSSLLAACGLEVTGVGLVSDPQDGGAAGDARVNGDASLAADGGAEEGGKDSGASDGSQLGDAGNRDAGDASDANAPGDSGDSGDAGPPPPTSCKTLLAAIPSTFGKNGPYTIDPDGTGPKVPFIVYCEMSLDSGGWTLVGHSAPAGAPPFGWTTATGSPLNLALPYSLNVPASGLTFTEVLLADQATASLDAGTRAYKFSVAADFVAKYLDAAVSTSPVTTVLGPCNPGGGGPVMLQNGGATSVTDSFFFRDNATFNDPGLRFGLLARGFDTYFTNCNQGGDLKTRQGSVFVR